MHQIAKTQQLNDEFEFFFLILFCLIPKWLNRYIVSRSLLQCLGVGYAHFLTNSTRPGGYESIYVAVKLENSNHVLRCTEGWLHILQSMHNRHRFAKKLSILSDHSTAPHRSEGRKNSWNEKTKQKIAHWVEGRQKTT